MALVLTVCLVGCFPPVAESAKADLAKASDKAGNAKIESLRSFVGQHKASKDPRVQDLVTRGAMKLGYAEAEAGRYKEARRTFMNAAASYKGAGHMDPSFGTLKDQAAYQAIVCLAADGKDDMAVAELQAFIKTNPLSPLVYSAHKRLLRMDPDNRELYDSILQDAKEKQESEGRMAMARCGPLAAAELLRLSRMADTGIQVLERDSGMTADGASMAGLAKALLKQGLLVEGKELNLSDFRKQPAPFIWLADNHYLVVTKIDDQVHVFDPFLKGPRSLPLPQQSAAFRAPVLIPSN